MDIGQDDLIRFLDSLDVYKLANVVRKGREKAKEVTVEKGENGFLSDRIVLVPGSEKKKNKVVVRETLICNGSGNCQRKCGEFGRCEEGCLKEKERAKTGHRCSFRVMLTMHMHTLGTWRVEVMGRHVPLTAVWVPPVKNPLRNQSTRTKCLEALQSGEQTVRKVSMKLVETERPTKRQLESFIFTQKKKLKTGPGNVQGLVDYPISDEEI